ncbi:bifunctional cytidylyltransferase/SDR family oxidoreductase [Nonomuraea sp. NPDC049152]|uniref:bifunctional cytidylyltransferase/SDR family oxidoreductase n=1 Tax=Nonomuraea sp. NPDC049152 TaxID=3154350 RepID=UPI0033F46C0A
MESRLRSVAVVLAGGVGQRVGLNTPKQLVTVAGKSIIEHTLALFDAAPEIDEIIVLMTPGFTAEVEKLVAARGFGKVGQVLEGGASRTETTRRALDALGPEECNVLLHDAVRPLLEPQIITECVEALRLNTAVEVAIPSSDTIVVVEPGPHGDVVREVPERARLRRVQTPQGFRLSVIREAYERAFADPDFGRQPPTDDCGVVLRYLPEVPIVVVRGSERNIKVTHPVDLLIADTLFRMGPSSVSPASGSALEGRTVVVVGDERGVGAEVAELARARGAARVLLLPPASVATPQVSTALREVGRVDCVVHAAPVRPAGGLAEVGDDYLAAVTVARAAHPHLRESHGRLLLLTSSRSAGGVLARAGAAAIAELSRALAEEWAEDGIAVNCVNAEGAGAARVSVDVLASDLTGQALDA